MILAVVIVWLLVSVLLIGALSFVASRPLPAMDEPKATDAEPARESLQVRNEVDGTAASVCSVRAS
jgi:hypothetical protein